MTHRYFSQHGEDFLLWNLFDHKQSGFFVDVGAFNGVHLSNTYSFEQEGWTGICIEPHPEYFFLCKQARPNSVCLNVACVGNDDIDRVEFYVEESGLYSGLLDGREEDICQKYQHGWGLEFPGLQQIVVPASTLNAILRQHVPPDIEIDFISIDVEGTELDVLKGLDLTQFHSRVLVIETNTDKDKDLITTHLSQFGYIEARQQGVNTFYVTDLSDVASLQKLEVEYYSEKNLHPLGEKYTLSAFLEKRYQSERQQHIAQLQKQAEKLKVYREQEKKYLEQLKEQAEKLKVYREQEKKYFEQLKEQDEKLKVYQEQEEKYLEQLKEQAEKLKVYQEQEEKYLEQFREQSEKLEQMVIENETLKTRLNDLLRLPIWRVVAFLKRWKLP